MAPTEKRHKRVLLWLVATVALLLIAGAAGYVHCFLWLPMGTGPAGPAVPREAFAETWGGQSVVLLGLGDSITAGFGSSSGLGYFDRIRTNPPGEFPDMQGVALEAVLPNMTTLNLSVNGSTSIDLLEDQIPALSPQPPDVLGVVTITTGGNDLIHMYGRIPAREGAMYGATVDEATSWVANFRERLDVIVDQIESVFPGGCHIFLANIYDPSDGLGKPEMAGLPPWPDMLAVLEAYNRVIEDCAARHESVHLVDIRTAFLGHGVTCRQFWRQHYDRDDPHYWYFENLEDPNDRGYDAIRRLFLVRMASVMNPAP